MLAADPPAGVIFDLGGTLIQLRDDDRAIGARWRQSYERLVSAMPSIAWPTGERYVEAMTAAEAAHWARVNAELWSGPPQSLLADGFRRLGLTPHDAMLDAALEGYALTVAGWSEPDPEALATLLTLRERGYRLGLLSNTWWAADWHDADLASHGLVEYLDVAVYTSELRHSKPHPMVFWLTCERLGVVPSACVMVGDRLRDDVGGALGAGLRGVWRTNSSPWPRPPDVVPSAVVDRLGELPSLLRGWGGD
ncbi:MAG: HAD-IA family hydrolase [Chloroflexi bacterium]|nr:HAD-IA family hydrolase [Chloroflexota bacterium]